MRIRSRLSFVVSCLRLGLDCRAWHHSTTFWLQGIGGSVQVKSDLLPSWREWPDAVGSRIPRQAHYDEENTRVKTLSRSSEHHHSFDAWVCALEPHWGGDCQGYSGFDRVEDEGSGDGDGDGKGGGQGGGLTCRSSSWRYHGGRDEGGEGGGLGSGQTLAGVVVEGIQSGD